MVRLLQAWLMVLNATLVIAVPDVAQGKTY
jgi:hypothetical protein